ncbi:MAG: hypothetical protein KKF66_06375, partial [Actinobacteria bacterium]|nr:hypothetical protein [Actinomycetota bacterium]
MTVKASVQEYSWIHVDYVASVRSLAARGRRILPYVVAALLTLAAVLFAVSCNGSTVAFSNDSTVW